MADKKINEEAEARSAALAAGGIDKHPAQITAEQLSSELGTMRSFIRQQILRIHDILNPTLNAPDDPNFAWPSNDPQLYDMYREYFTRLHGTFVDDVRKANQIITTRNNEILGANQKIDRLTADATKEADDLRFRINQLEASGLQIKQILEATKQELESIFARYGVIQARRCDENAEATQTIENLRASVRILTKELTLEMDAHATSQRALAEARRRHKHDEKLPGNWKAALDGLGTISKMSAFVVDQNMTESTDVSKSETMRDLHE